MPRVPDAFTPSIAVQPARLPELAAGDVAPVQDLRGRQLTGLGQGLARAGSAITIIAGRLQDEVNAARLKEADALASDTIRKALVDPERGYFRLRGQDALDGRKGVIEAVEKDLRAIGDQLDNPAQRQAFGDRVERRRQDFLQRVDGHYSDQQLAFAVARSAARATALGSDAFEAWFAPRPPGSPQGAQDVRSEPIVPGATQGLGSLPGGPAPQPAGPSVPPATFRDYLTSLEGELRTLGDLRGEPPEAIEQRVRKGVTGVHAAIVSRLIGEERAGEAADYLRRYGDDMEPAVRADLDSRVRRAQVDELGFLEAREARAGGGDPLQQISRLEGRYDAGEIPYGVMAAGVREVRRHADEQHSLSTRKSAEVLSELQKWSQLNRHTTLNENQWETLRQHGVDDDMELFLLRGGQYVMTLAGYHTLDTITQAELLDHKEFDTLEAEHRLDLSVEGMAELQQKWEKAWVAAGRAAASATKGGQTIGTRSTVTRLLRERSALFNQGQLNEGEKWRIDALVAEVDTIFAAQNRDPQSQQELNDAVMRVWSEGAVVDDQWRPFAMMSPAERAKARSFYRRAGGPGGPDFPGAVAEITPQDFDIGGRFAALRNPETGLPDWAALAGRDVNPASLVDDLMILRAGQEGAANVPFRDEEGNLIARASTRLPTYEEAALLLSQNEEEPSHSQIMRSFAELVVQQEMATEAARGFADRTMEVRRTKFQKQVRGEFNRLVAKYADEALEPQRAHQRRVEAVLAEHPHAKVVGQTESWGTPTHTVVEWPTGRHEQVSPSEVRWIPGPPHREYLRLPAEPPSRDALEKAAWRDLVRKHQVKLDQFGWGSRMLGGLFHTGPGIRNLVPEMGVQVPVNDALWNIVHGDPPDGPPPRITDDSGLYGPGTRWVGGLFEGPK